MFVKYRRKRENHIQQVDGKITSGGETDGPQPPPVPPPQQQPPPLHMRVGGGISGPRGGGIPLPYGRMPMPGYIEDIYTIH